MVSNLAWLRARLPPGLRLNHNIEVDELVRERRHVVREAEGVFAGRVGSEDVVTLLLGVSIKYVFVIRVFDLKVDLERGAGLDSKIELGVVVHRFVDGGSSVER